MHIKIWGTEGEELMQFLHFCFAIGGVLSPLFSEQFLAPKSTQNDCSSNATLTLSTLNETSLSVNETQPCNNTGEAILPKETDVKYAFMITGVLSIISALTFFYMFFSNRRVKKDSMAEAVRFRRKLPKHVIVVTIVMLCIFYGLYCSVEDTFASFLMTFLVTGYDSVSKSKGAFATAVYWGSFASARFAMVFVSSLLSPLKLLSICISSMLVTYTCFVIGAEFAAINLLIVLGVFAGLSMSAVFPAGFSWTEANIFPVNGMISAAILVASSCGTMANPLFLGYMMERVDYKWFAYIILIETVLMSLVFLILFLFTRFYLNKNFETGRPNDKVTVTVSADDVEQEESFLNRTNRR